MSASRSVLLDSLLAANAAVERTPLPPNLGTLFDNTVQLYGDRPLWVDVEGSQTLTYRAFAAEVVRAVAALHALGVGRGTRVALMLPSVPALAITWMALAKLGAVMIPVNTRYTERELDHVLHEGQAELLIADHTHLPLLERNDAPPPLPRDRIVLHGGSALGYAGEFHELLRTAPPPPPLPAVDTDDTMTIQFTSGSTGAPKGCLLSHRYWLVIGLVRAQQGPPVQRMLIDMPFHYMGGQWRFLMALNIGATAFVAPQPSLTRMIDRLLAHDIEFCSVAPALARQPLDPRRNRLNLRWAGTMALPRDMHAPLQDRIGGAPVREMYGLTETGATLAMPVAVDWMTGSGSVGLPVPFRRLRIVNEAGHDVSTGVPGELWISGPGLTQGYHGCPEATQSAFSGEWFRTGDLFQADREGFHTMLGRIKDVIRRNGENISASELESVLCGMPDIMEAVAIPVPDPARGEEVKVLLVLRPGLSQGDMPPERVLEFCRERLARFKLPRYIAYLPELPKTASGKPAKPLLRPAGQDLRLNSFDTKQGIWR